MTYPRRCPLCEIDFSAVILQSAGSARDHVTVDSISGGTRSPWLPELPGRVLTLACTHCAGRFRWDYFGSRSAA